MLIRTDAKPDTLRLLLRKEVIEGRDVTPLVLEVKRGTLKDLERVRSMGYVVEVVKE